MSKGKHALESGEETDDEEHLELFHEQRRLCRWAEKCVSRSLAAYHPAYLSYLSQLAAQLDESAAFGQVLSYAQAAQGRRRGDSDGKKFFFLNFSSRKANIIASTSSTLDPSTQARMLESSLLDSIDGENLPTSLTRQTSGPKAAPLLKRKSKSGKRPNMVITHRLEDLQAFAQIQLDVRSVYKS